MSDDRPDQGEPREPEQDREPVQAPDLEARRTAASEGAFPGLRSASDIFGAPRRPEDWPTRRERREAERVAGATDEVQPLPEAAPVPDGAEPAGGDPRPVADVAQPAAGAPRPVSAAARPFDDDATQAVSMPEELARPNQGRTPTPPASVRPATTDAPTPDLGSRIPPAAAVPPSTTAPHPRSIQLPSAQSSRAERAVEAQEIDDERRRVDPLGTGRDDVDWLGRATGSAPRVGPEEVSATTTGVPDALPSSEEPPSFTDLIGLPGARSDDGAAASTTGRLFDWAAQESGPVQMAGDRDPGERVDRTAAPATAGADAADGRATADGATTALPAVGAGGGAGAAAGAGAATGADTGEPTQAWSLADLEDAERGGSDRDPVAGAAGAAGAAGVAGAAEAVDTGAPTQAWSLADIEDAERGGTDPGPAANAAAGGAGADGAAGAGSGTDTGEPTQAWSLADTEDAERSAAPAAVPWWAEPEPTPPPTAAPPLIDPQPTAAGPYPGGHLPPAVGQDLDALLGIRTGDDRTDRAAGPTPTGDELDQTEWTDRETSDTGVIHDLFGTGAMQQLDEPEQTDTGTRMMPVVGAGGSARPASGPDTSGATRPARADGRDNFINEGFGRLQGEGRRGKQFLFIGAIALIVVLLVAVFLLTKWILGGDPQSQPGPTQSPAAASSQRPSADASAPAATAATPTTPTIGFATEPAAPGEHSWRELAGGECLSPYTDAWADTVTVVDCATPHQGQLTVRKAIDAAAYPGASALAGQVTAECQSSAALDLAAASAWSDLQVQGTYPPDQAAWDQGDRSTSCFASRASGEALTGSLAPTA